MSGAVTTAVVPAGGLGTRFLPATRAVPKELLPLLDRPLIQYAVEEAAAAGVADVVIVTGPGKDALRTHFEPDERLERLLAARGARDQLEKLCEITRLPRVRFVVQDSPRGLGHAVLTARELVGERPFIVILPDEIVMPGGSLLARMMEIHADRGGSLIGLATVDSHLVSSYGIVRPGVTDGDVCAVEDMVEKPPPGRAPSRLAMIGRYVISPSVFPVLESLAPGTGGEVQLTDALRALIGPENVWGILHDGARFDTGALPGYLAASIYMARRRPGLWDRVAALLEGTEDR